jgi:hypothetical protein
MRLGKLGHQPRRWDELHRIAGQDRLAPDCYRPDCYHPDCYRPDCYRKVRLADTGRP